MNEELERKLRKAESDKNGSYDKRTDHLDAKGNGLFINRLVLEDSPYLLQHAHNPVDWHPWGDEAFAIAEAEDKPVFLSIGYSTCHWCHVMEVESFDNTEVAKILNKHFVSIKLDREQYPDIDEIYMTGVQLMSGHGGWPMSSFLLPDGKPFFGATYFPAPTFIALLNQIAGGWQDKRSELESSAASISESIDRLLGDRKPPEGMSQDLLSKTIAAILTREDPTFGGLAGSPKFPQEPLLLLLLDKAHRDRDATAYDFAFRALQAMAQGGIYDQIAGGFHRYSVDSQWLVPHFEKMLYNQSQLSACYLKAYRLSGDQYFLRIIEQTLNYVLRDMQIAGGGFYSATDADSEGEEGTFFTWTIAQLEIELQPAELDLVVALYGVTEQGNFEGSNILHLPVSIHRFAQDQQIENIHHSLDGILQKLYLAREQRIHPLRDDKMIVAWTGLMISVLAETAMLLENTNYLTAAELAAKKIIDENIDEQGKLYRISLNGTVSISGQLEDYANLCLALLSLFDATGKSEYLEQSVSLMNVALAEFWDVQSVGFFQSPAQQNGPQLSRSRNASDSACLSATATSLICLIRLNNRRFLMPDFAMSQAEANSKLVSPCFESLSPYLNENSIAYPSVLRALSEYTSSDGDAVQYVDGGRAKLVVRRVNGMTENDRITVRVTLELLQGWHITAPTDVSSDVSPLQVSVASEESNYSLQHCDYPAGNGFVDNNGKRTSTYEGRIEFDISLCRQETEVDSLSWSIGLVLKLQLCNDNTCLLQQSLLFRI